MKFTIGVIVGMEDALKRLAVCRWLNGREAYGVAKLIQKLQPDIDFFHTQRDGLIRDRFGVQDKKEETIYTIPPENRKAFFEALAEVTAIENEYEIVPVTIRGDIETGLSPAELIALEGVIKIADD